MSGYLFVIVGNSGVGKDSLLANFQSKVGTKDRFIFPKRWITRDLFDSNESYLALSLTEFQAKMARGEFFVFWEAYGYCYGVGCEIADYLNLGYHVVINTSRQVVAELRRRYPLTRVVLVTAPDEVVVGRIQRRARGMERENRERFSRMEQFKDFNDWDIRVENSGEIGNACRQLLAEVDRILASSDE